MQANNNTLHCQKHCRIFFSSVLNSVISCCFFTWFWTLAASPACASAEGTKKFWSIFLHKNYNIFHLVQYLTTNSKVIFKEKQQYLLFAFLINNSKSLFKFLRGKSATLTTNKHLKALFRHLFGFKYYNCIQGPALEIIVSNSVQGPALEIIVSNPGPSVGNRYS